jgi:DNA-directed RNA polymerase subunit RPC12/RpoP
MGTLHEYICADCGYRVMVSGGNDVGLAARTATIYCEDCRELQDVATSYEPWEDRETFPPRCKVAASHTIRRWNDLDPCPRCGDAMEPTGDYRLWD